MPPRKLNCWEDRKCGREPGGSRIGELGPCPAAVDTTCDGANEGQRAGRLCWAVAGTFCEGEAQGTHAQRIQTCERCAFFRRVKYEEGSRFQLLRPGMGTNDPAELHRQLNHVVELLSICRDIFACLAMRPLLSRLSQHALAITHSISASVYLVAPSRKELTLEAHAGSEPRPDRVALAEDSPAAEAVRAGRLCHGTLAQPDHAEPLHVLTLPVGGNDGLRGVLELVKPDGFSSDDEWFIRELGIIAGLGIVNARHVDELRQLKRFDKAKSRFVAVLMHHIGSPLATIACSLQALNQLGESLKPDDRQKLIGISLDRISSIQTLSRRLLDLAAIRNGTSLAAIRPVNPAEPLRQEVEARIPTARERGVQLVLTEPEAQPLVRADPDGLRVVFANLLDNAIKYSTREEKRVDAMLRVVRGCVRVSVRDRGMGIPPDEQERIFEEFHRASNATTSKIAGFGLGLAAVKELVDRYGGKMELESTLGVGTTFSIDFPIAEK